jgi:hypothetical protein
MFLAVFAFAGIYRRLDFQHDVDRFDQGWGMAFQPFFAKCQVGSFKSVERNGFPCGVRALTGSDSIAAASLIS